VSLHHPWHDKDPTAKFRKRAGSVGAAAVDTTVQIQTKNTFKILYLE